jgi:TolA-binding protein
MSSKTKQTAPKAEIKPAGAQPAAKTQQGDDGIAEDRLTEWFMDVFVPQYGKQAGIVVATVAIGLIVWFSYRGMSHKAEQTSNRMLGKAYVYLSQEKLDSAAAALQDVLNDGPGGIAEAKAHLLLGNVRYSQGRFDDALKSYSSVKVSSTSYPLVASGALHGLAASSMEKKDYAKAAEYLETFVHDFGRRSGNPVEKLAGQEVVDPVPAMPNALWKLALCYRELKDNAKAKSIAEKLVKVYPETREGAEAAKLLVTL